MERGRKYLEVFGDKGWEELYENHTKVWTEKWKYSDIKITGDIKAQLALRTSIYHLIRSNCENDPRVAICAKGYAGEAYFGHYFWDTEINMLPFFIHTNPKAARDLIMFRYNTLDGARKNAKDYGYQGARYAWESSVSGEEQCPCWQYADHEIHITADIVYAMWHYVNGTGDFEFIWDYGIDIMIETARYWVNRVDVNKNGYYELLGVMGPDEYLPMTMNNAFTNRIVKFSLNKTVECLETISKTDSNKYKAIEKRLTLKSDEIKRFKEVGDNLMLPYDENTVVIPQSEDFQNYADLDFDVIWKDRTKPFGHFISQEKNYRSKALKQADVIQMMMMFPGDFTLEQLNNSYDYYEPITTHDSSLSAAVHGITAAWMGRMKEAEKFLKKVMDIDMSIEKKGAAEGIHIANCGGLWQMVVYGFAGLKSAMWNNEICLEPHLPEKWEELEFTLAWHGKWYKAAITKEKYEIFEMQD
jgi:kojibiose phosphorylase